MNLFAMIVLIVLIGCVTSVLTERYKALGRGGGGGLAAGERAAIEDARNTDRAEIAALRDRVRVLERIVTDERAPRRLSAEIEALRKDDGTGGDA